MTKVFWPNAKINVADDGAIATTSIAKTPTEFIFEFIKDGSTVEMNVDGTTPVTYKYTATRDMNLVRVNMFFGDSLVELGKFGNIAALTNGVLIQVTDTDGSTVLQHFGTDSEPIKKGADFAPLAGIDATPIDGQTAGDYQLIRWTISKAGGNMRLSRGQSFQMIIRDNLTGLLGFRVMVQGVSVE